MFTWLFDSLFSESGGVFKTTSLKMTWEPKNRQGSMYLDQRTRDHWTEKTWKFISPWFTSLQLQWSSWKTFQGRQVQYPVNWSFELKKMEINNYNKNKGSLTNTDYNTKGNVTNLLLAPDHKISFHGVSVLSIRVVFRLNLVYPDRKIIIGISFSCFSIKIKFPNHGSYWNLRAWV